MATAYVQGASNSRTTGGTSITVAFGSNNAAGNRLVALVQTGTVGSAASTPTDTAGNTWVAVTTATVGGTGQQRLFECRSCLGGANTVTLAQSASTVESGWIMEFSGADTGAPELTPTGTTGSGNTAAGAALTAYSAGDILITGIGDDGGATSAFSMSAGWTIPTGVSTTDGVNTARSSGAYQVNVSAGSNTPSWTTSGAPGWGVHDAAIKATAAGFDPTTVPPFTHPQHMTFGQKIGQY